MSESALPPVGSQIGGYRLVRVLGEGGFGAVFEASDEALGRTVALKLLKTADVERFVLRFRREARILSALEHPGIVRFFDAGESGGRTWMALELLPGRTVAAEIEAVGPFAIDRAVGIARQVLAALEYAHARTVLHRDLKPENVMLVGEGADERAKILDFGLAWVYEPEGRGLTAEGTSLGTLQYMSPEQAMGDLKKIGPALGPVGPALA